MLSTLKRIVAVCLGASLPLFAQAESPKIAVTDLSYEETVRGYFQNIEYKGKYRASSSESARSSDFSDSASSRSRESGEVSFKSTTGYEVYIDRGELRKFTGDIKGELLKSGYRVVQGKPWTAQNTEKLYDIIDRIKQGYYPGANYVLWGTITNVEFRRDDNPVQGSNHVSHALSLELVAEFSLIDTKTYEVKAAFTAMGEGSDVKLGSAGTRLTLNRSKVMFEVAKSLGEAVAQEVDSQFGEGGEARGNRREGRRDARNGQREPAGSEEKVIIYR